MGAALGDRYPVVDLHLAFLAAVLASSACPSQGESLVPPVFGVFVDLPVALPVGGCFLPGHRGLRHCPNMRHNTMAAPMWSCSTSQMAMPSIFRVRQSRSLTFLGSGVRNRMVIVAC